MLTFDVVSPTKRWECELSKRAQDEHKHGVPGIHSAHWRELVHVGSIEPVLGDILKPPQLQRVRAAFAREAFLARFGASTWEVGDIPYESRYTDSGRAPMRLSEYVTTHLDGCSGGAAC